MNTTIKYYLSSLLLGFVATALVAAFILTISLDMRWMSTVAMVLSFIAGYFLRSRLSTGNSLIGSLLLTIGYALFFFLVVSPGGLPSLSFFVPAFCLSSMLGQYTSSLKSKRALLIGADSVLIIVLAFIIPLFISGDLTHVMNEKGADFLLTSHTGEAVDSRDMEGEVIVLDFYGTWCKPCIYELPELAKVKAAFKDSDKVNFFVVNFDYNGDTIEKAKRFAQKHDFGFDYAYDYDGVAYEKLGLLPYVDGAPSLLIIDQKGNIRLKHVGFNKSETDFVENMINSIEALIAED
jgi:peroxiredoxin